MSLHPNPVHRGALEEYTKGGKMEVDFMVAPEP